MYRRLNRHLTTNNVLTTEQFGFRKGISTENATFSLTDKILKAFNKKMHVGGIFCDLAKAFDCVNHDILLAKLNFYGLQGTALDLFKSYLANRKQKVQIQTENMSQASSEWGTIEHGVPQGSILGPLLFIIYINDLPATINNLSQPILFADDTSVTITSKNISDFCSIGNSVLSEMNKWFIANKLVLNFDKTKVIKFVSNNLTKLTFHISYSSTNIEETTDIKFLGVHLDDHLNWNVHVQQLIPKLSAACYAIRSLFHITNIDTLKSIYFAYFHSVMNYGIIFWGNSTDSKKIFILQKKIIRIMTGTKHRASCRNLFKKLSILPLPCQYIFSLMMFVVKNQENFENNSSVHCINTRHRQNLHRPNANLSCFQKGAYYSGIKIYNHLPCHLKELSCNKETFKKELRIYLNTHTFYSVDDFFSANKE